MALKFISDVPKYSRYLHGVGSHLKADLNDCPQYFWSNVCRYVLGSIPIPNAVTDVVKRHFPFKKTIVLSGQACTLCPGGSPFLGRQVSLIMVFGLLISEPVMCRK